MTPQATRAPALPVGRVTRSSSFAWTITDRSRLIPFVAGISRKFPGIPRTRSRFAEALGSSRLLNSSRNLAYTADAPEGSQFRRAISCRTAEGKRMAQIGIYANRNLVIAPRNSTAREVAQTMAKFNIGAVMIVDGAEVVGMVTERTICRKIVGGKRATDSPIDDLIETNIPRMGLDTTIRDAVEAMRRGESRYLFIVEGEPPVVTGVLSMQDLIRALSALCENEAEQLRKYVTGEL
jgi:CBS domain-containing protein